MTRFGRQVLNSAARSAAAFVCMLAATLAWAAATPAKVQPASPEFARAEKLRIALAQKPESRRSSADYQTVIDAFKQFYTRQPAAAQADAAVAAVGDVLADRGRVLSDPKSLDAAVSQYQLLFAKYPTSTYRYAAYLAIAQIYQYDLHDRTAARDAYQDFVKRFPNHPLAQDARQALAQLNSPFAANAVLEARGASGRRGALPTTARLPAVAAAPVPDEPPVKKITDLPPATATATATSGPSRSPSVAAGANVGAPTVFATPSTATVSSGAAKPGVGMSGASAQPSASAAARLAGREARPTLSGDRSLTRALGLKVGRIVVDAGHGGHDTGTIGPTGLREKDLVLDVALRLGKLLEARLGAEVIYTRKDDTFIPLEERTAIANREGADLFISVHANSSDDPDARGVETYYLNFTSSPGALEVAARENAAAEKSVHELQDVVKKITMTEKIEESREFATNVQRALYSGLAPKGSTTLVNRGVKKAPFVVLIGANMPSILAEISFLSNPTDEGRMRTPQYRQKIAESLYRGVSRYAGGLSGVKVASREAQVAAVQ